MEEVTNFAARGGPTMANANRMREERLQIMLSAEELVLVDDFRFKKRMPSRASAVRELLKRGLAAEGIFIGCGRREVIRVRSRRQDAYGTLIIGKMFTAAPCTVRFRETLAGNCCRTIL